jgi:hypothetical protein
MLLDGELIVSGSRDPEPELARALLARSYTGFADVIDVKMGKTRSRVNIDKAARVETIEGPNGPFWRRQQRPTDRAYTAKTESLRSDIAANAFWRVESLSVE